MHCKAREFIKGWVGWWRHNKTLNITLPKYFDHKKIRQALAQFCSQYYQVQWLEIGVFNIMSNLFKCMFQRSFEFLGQLVIFGM